MRALLRGTPVLLVLVVVFFHSSAAQECLLKEARQDFIIDVDMSVKKGATFVSSPKLDRYRDCQAACCKHPRCNLAFMETNVDSEDGFINSCFLFDCLYNMKYVCHFVKKKGYHNYILDSVYESYLEVEQPPTGEDLPPVANGGPDRVVQPQDTVTLNGIASKDDNEITSYQWQMITVYPSAVIEKTHFVDQILVSNLTSGVYKFQLTVTDSSGQSNSDLVTVLVLTPEQSEHHCMAPKKIGPCRGAFPRWHYNGASEKCEEFTFGGCKENLNNYLSKDECTNACYGSEKGAKSGRGLPLPTDQGEKCDTPCTTEQFTCDNGCCLDPGLECDASPQCSDGSDELKCDDLTDKFRILMQIPLDEQKVRCTEHIDTGDCRDSITKWYYNPVHQDCQRFNYGGCRGNENRFDNKDSCLKVCRGVTEKDVFARREEFERSVAGSQTGVIVIAALLGLAILVLLGVLVYCLTRGRKSSQHQRVPVNSVPVMTADREHLVYNSTTKPI